MCIHSAHHYVGMPPTCNRLMRPCAQQSCLWADEWRSQLRTKVGSQKTTPGKLTATLQCTSYIYFQLHVFIYSKHYNGKVNLSCQAQWMGFSNNALRSRRTEVGFVPNCMTKHLSPVVRRADEEMCAAANPALYHVTPKNVNFWTFPARFWTKGKCSLSTCMAPVK